MSLPSAGNEPKMLAGETTLWTGRPDPRVLFTPADALLIPFSVLFIAFAAWWLGGVILSKTAPGFFVAFGSLFIAAGLFQLFGRFFAKVWMKNRTRYVLTDRRAIVIGPRSTREVGVNGGIPIERRISRDGRHLSVEFTLPAINSWRTRRQSMAYSNTGLDILPGADNQRVIAFWDVEDVVALQSALDRIAR